TNRWRPLARPLALGPAVVAWTGHEVLYWGGGCCASVNPRGTAYDPATDSWRQLPVAPIRPGFGAGGVWTGTEFIVFGGSTATENGLIKEAAAYNPATNTWRRLASLPAPRLSASVTWTGTEVLVVGGFASGLNAPSSDGVAYNPATNRWRTLPKMPTPRAEHSAVWTGHYLLVWGGYVANLSDGERTSPPHGLAYDPVTNKWLSLPAAPLRGRVGALAVWTGNTMIVWGGLGNAKPTVYLLDGATYRP
ncbi:MAG: Kelch repeat-containing protein, partial [Betaproteobacteria bacterium]